MLRMKSSLLSIEKESKSSSFLKVATNLVIRFG
jgi:hypothetical protein